MVPGRELLPDLLWIALNVLETAKTEKERRSATGHLAALVREARDLTPRQAEGLAAFIEKTGPQLRDRNAKADRDAEIVRVHDALWSMRYRFTPPITSLAAICRAIAKAHELAASATPGQRREYVSARTVEEIVRRRKRHQ